MTSTIKTFQFKELVNTFQEAEEALHAFALPHIQQWFEYLKYKGTNSVFDATCEPELYRFTEIHDHTAHFDFDDYYNISIPLAFFDDPEPFLRRVREEKIERDRRKSLEAEDVRRKRIAELQRLLAEDAPPTELDNELTRRYY